MVDEKVILEELKKVVDPELGKDIVSMGLIKKVDVHKGDVIITMTLTSPYCPLAGLIVEDVRNRVASIKGVDSVKVDLVF